ncbi:synaptotagmin-like protein 3 [Heptranchias perlo]|uniref:synaptotagmin-like protein 3 n=1 Tax=Heptranchias perlo TaxID=212740 RepID=UPI0035595E59
MTLEIDIKSLKGLEREKVLEVLHRDEMLRKAEEERIRKLKSEYQEIRRKGAKSCSREYSSRSCARCQVPLGLVFNIGAVCSICSHKVCSKCRVYNSSRVWRCTVCNAHGQMKVKSGEWFIEERAKKFHQEQGKHETISEKLLQTFRTLSNIAIVPPTPPPAGYPLEDRHSKGFTRSMENLFWSLTGHMKQISKSNEDVMKDSKLLTANYGTKECELKKERSQSDTALANTSKVWSAQLFWKDSMPNKTEWYVKTYLLPDKSPQSKLKSTMKKNSVDPVFNETLRYNIERSQLEMRTLQVSVWHCTTLKRKVFLGEVQIPFEDWKFEENLTQSYNWYQLRGKILPIGSQWKLPVYNLDSPCIKI